MRRRIYWIGAAMAALLVIPAAAAQAGEEKVALDKVPRPVAEAVKARFKDAKVTGAAKETVDGKTVFEITIQDHGRNVDVTLHPDGELALIEREITRNELPQPAGSALSNKYPKATYKIVEEITKVEKKRETLAYYEVLLVTAQKQALEVQVAADGKILQEERKDLEKEDK